MPHDENMEIDESVEGTESLEKNESDKEKDADESEKERAYTQEDIDRVVSREKARLERKYRKEEESKLNEAKQLEATLRIGLGLNENDDVLSKVKDFYKNQGIDIPEIKQSVNNRDAEILGKADADEIIDTCDYQEIEARANELALKQQKGKTSARENAEFFALGKYLTDQLKEKELEDDGIDTSILKDKEFREFVNKFNQDTKMSEIYNMWERMNDSIPKKPASTGSSQSTVPDNQVKEYYTPEEVDKLSNEELDDPNIWQRVRNSMKRWK